MSATTALHWAAEGGHPAVATLLLDSGAQIDPVDSWFALAPLGWACVVDWNPCFRENRPATIQLLLERGARMDAFCAIALGRTDEIRKLSPQQVTARLGVAAAYSFPLHYAIASGNAVAVDELLALGAPLDCRTADGLSPLGLALLGGQIDIAERLRRAGASEDLSARLAADPPDALGALSEDAPLLHALAARDRHVAITSLLIAGMPPDFRMPALIPAEEQVDELTPLARAVSAGHIKAARALLSGGADPNGCVGRSALTPLHLAARAGNEEMARLLLNAGADPTKCDLAFNATPAGWAAHFHHDTLAKILAINHV